MAQPVCRTCSECVAGETYETGACQATKDRVCTQCALVCARGQYITRSCTKTSDLQCGGCVTKCPGGKYMNPGKTSCTGAETEDIVLSGCSACLVPTDCRQGEYLDKLCTGSEVKKNECVACSRGNCVLGVSYGGGCGGLQPTRCLNLTVCAAGFYLDKWSDVSDGECRRCSRCETFALSTERPCGAIRDTRCGGDPCDEWRPCNQTASGSRFCNYLLDSIAPTCGVCPTGYTSDGQTCQECPEGKTCSLLGAVECEGQCGPGVVSRCDATWGYARCDGGPGAVECVLNETRGRLVMRGTYTGYGSRAGQQGDCGPYFRCDVGWFKRFSMQGVADCAPCMSVLGQLARYVSGGLSSGDSLSCLWECDATISGVSWNPVQKQCEVKAGALQRVARHPAGSYGIERDEGYPVTTCRPLHTTRENTALVAGDCMPCPPIPSNAEEVVGARNCEWRCVDGWRQVGGRCVRVRGAGWACTDAGTTRLDDGSGGGECSPSAVPWNPAGTRKVWPRVRVAGERFVAPQTVSSQSTANGTVRVSSVSSGGGSEILAMSVGGGVGGRHWVSVDGQRVGVEGAVCSAARLAMNGRSYLVCAVCNESFLAYVDLMTPADAAGTASGARAETVALGGVATTMRGGRQALQVLIGQAGRPGWADGFKTQARFGVELYVATAGGDESVWVLDRWNCVVREVVVWAGGPGDYRTRVHTVHGLTERFLLVPPSPKCYGPGSLAGPRRFLDVGYDLLIFSDDTGLWQLETTSGSLARVLDESWGVGTLRGVFEADDVASVRFRHESVAVNDFGPVIRKCRKPSECYYPQCMASGEEVLCTFWGACYTPGKPCPFGNCPVGSILVYDKWWRDAAKCEQCPPGKYVAAANATSCSPGRYDGMTLRFKDGAEWDLVANTEPCGDDYTSNVGGDCSVGCAWQDGSNYVDPASGACVSCGTLACGVGEQLVKCTRSAPARCEACPVRGSGKVYVVAGRCDEDEMRYLAPCPVGLYLSGQYCEQCGDPLKTTAASGATRVEQCECRRGLQWSQALRRCVGRALYVYDEWGGGPQPDYTGDWLTEEYKCGPGEYLRGFNTSKDKDCRRCPANMVGRDRVKCEWCEGPLETPYALDQSGCVCKGGAAMNRSGGCECETGRRFNATTKGCEWCPLGMFGAGGQCYGCGAGTYSGALGATVCEQCTMGKYRLFGQSGGCRSCGGGPGHYAPVPWNDTCVACNRSCDGKDGWSYAGPCPDGSVGFGVCLPCRMVLPGNATWVKGGGCVYKCNAGYYFSEWDMGACKPCSVAPCPAGLQGRACTEYEDRTCDTECSNTSKPVFHSKWVVSGVGGAKCPWECESGYSAKMTDYVLFQIHECVPSGDGEP